MSADHAMLILLPESLGEVGQRRWMLDQDEVLIGRDPTATVHLPDRQVSRRHARIVRRDEAFYVEDLGSKNGTFVNGEPIPPHRPRRLADGDVLSIGLAYRLTFVDREGTVPLTFEPHRPPLIELDEDRRAVKVGGRVLDPPLSPAQFELLRLLYRAGGRTVSRDEIVEAVWGDEAAEGVTDQALDALVRRLRRRLAELAPDREFIVTVRGHGFRLNRE